MLDVVCYCGERGAVANNAWDLEALANGADLCAQLEEVFFEFMPNGP